MARVRTHANTSHHLLLLVSICTVLLLTLIGISSGVSPMWQAGSVGVSVSVAANPVNMMVVQLRERAGELAAKEAALNARAEALDTPQSVLVPLGAGVAAGAILIGFMFALHLFHDRHRPKAV